MCGCDGGGAVSEPYMGCVLSDGVVQCVWWISVKDGVGGDRMGSSGGGESGKVGEHVGLFVEDVPCVTFHPRERVGCRVVCLCMGDGTENVEVAVFELLTRGECTKMGDGIDSTFTVQVVQHRRRCVVVRKEEACEYST